ncbi:MAG: TlpA family protein disulfide reductase [Chloroflexaceae bacterium]|nr:TlpA family protein disulfide reductase [Chloroflexaceae bacterium]
MSLQQRLGIFCCITLIIGTISACGASSASTPPAGSHPGATIAVESAMLDTTDTNLLEVGDRAPDFRYTLADGSQHRLSDFQGQKVLLNFWASWCPPCTHEMPDIQQAATTHAADGLTVLAVNFHEEADVIESFATEHNLSIPLIANPSGDISTRYGVTGLPVSFFINTDGTISYKQIGLLNTDFIELRLERMQ